jgi:hypothetical protein
LASAARGGRAAALRGDAENLHRQWGTEAAAATAGKPYRYPNRQERNTGAGRGERITFDLFFLYSSLRPSRVAICVNSKQQQGYRRVPVRSFVEKLGKLARIPPRPVSRNKQELDLTVEISLKEAGHFFWASAVHNLEAGLEAQKKSA